MLDLGHIQGELTSAALNLSIGLTLLVIIVPICYYYLGVDLTEACHQGYFPQNGLHPWPEHLYLRPPQQTVLGGWNKADADLFWLVSIL